MATPPRLNARFLSPNISEHLDIHRLREQVALLPRAAGLAVTDFQP